MTPASLALVVSTYNQPDYLQRVLKAVDRQTLSPSELLLADDGSDENTRQIFKDWSRARPIDCQHLWQPNEGFRKSRILNQAIARAQSDYIVLLDGDTVPHPEFVADHRRLATADVFVQGHRALIEQKAAPYFGTGNFAADRRRALWSGQLRGLKHAYRWPVPLNLSRSDLCGVRGCNLAIWRRDLLRVNGYNEAFVGWGREDSELAVRLMNSGVRRLDVRGWAICYHLWHPPASRGGLPTNDAILDEARAKNAVRCDLGVDQYLVAHKLP
jgi:glycosyltransferase involved in cell wall biosynthesis